MTSISWASAPLRGNSALQEEASDAKSGQHAGKLELPQLQVVMGCYGQAPT